MRSLRFSTRAECWERQRAAGRYNPGREALIHLRDRCLIVPIGAGGRDQVDVYQDHDRIAIVAVNTGLPYAGLELFTLEGEAAGDVFVQEGEAYESIGPKGVDYAPATIARRLGEYIY